MQGIHTCARTRDSTLISFIATQCCSALQCQQCCRCSWSVSSVAIDTPLSTSLHISVHGMPPPPRIHMYMHDRRRRRTNYQKKGNRFKKDDSCFHIKASGIKASGTREGGLFLFLTDTTTFTHTHAHVHAHAHTHTRARTHTHTRTHAYTHTHTYTHAHTHSHTHVRISCSTELLSWLLILS